MQQMWSACAETWVPQCGDQQLLLGVQGWHLGRASESHVLSHPRDFRDSHLVSSCLGLQAGISCAQQSMD